MLSIIGLQVTIFTLDRSDYFDGPLIIYFLLSATGVLMVSRISYILYDKFQKQIQFLVHLLQIVALFSHQLSISVNCFSLL